MTTADEPGPPARHNRRPTRELLLAQALDACLTAERQVPGSAQKIIARQPAWARSELKHMMSLRRVLENQGERGQA